MTHDFADAERRRGQSLIEIALLMPLVLRRRTGRHRVRLRAARSARRHQTHARRLESDLARHDDRGRGHGDAQHVHASSGLQHGSRMIFSVLKKGATTGTANYDQVILYQRHEYGALTGAERAADGGLRHVRRRAGLRGQQLRHQHEPADHESAGLPRAHAWGTGLRHRDLHAPTHLITPLDRFGVTVPNTLYSIAYF